MSHKHIPGPISFLGAPSLPSHHPQPRPLLVHEGVGKAPAPTFEPPAPPKAAPATAPLVTVQQALAAKGFPDLPTIAAHVSRYGYEVKKKP